MRRRPSVEGEKGAGPRREDEDGTRRRQQGTRKCHLPSQRDCVSPAYLGCSRESKAKEDLGAAKTEAIPGECGEVRGTGGDV